MGLLDVRGWVPHRRVVARFKFSLDRVGALWAIALLSGCPASVTTTSRDLADAGSDAATPRCVARWQITERAVALPTEGNAVLHGVAMRDRVPHVLWVEGPRVVRRPSYVMLSRYLGDGRFDRIDRPPFAGLGLDQRFQLARIAASPAGVLVTLNGTGSSGGGGCACAEWTSDASRITGYTFPYHCHAIARTDADRRALLVAPVNGNRSRFEYARWTGMPRDDDRRPGRDFPQEGGPGAVSASAFGADETLYFTWSSTAVGRVFVVAANTTLLDPVEVHPAAAASVAMAAGAEAWVASAPEMGPITLARVSPTLVVDHSATTLGASVDGARGVAATIVGEDLLVAYFERGASPPQRVAVVDARSGVLRATLVVESAAGAGGPVLTADGDAGAILLHTTDTNTLTLTTLGRCDGR